MYGAHIQLNIFTMILYYCYGALFFFFLFIYLFIYGLWSSVRTQKKRFRNGPRNAGTDPIGGFPAPHTPPPGPNFFLLGIFWAFNSWASSLSKPWPPLANLAQAAQTQAQLKKIKNPLIHITYKPNERERERERDNPIQPKLM